MWLLEIKFHSLQKILCLKHHKYLAKLDFTQNYQGTGNLAQYSAITRPSHDEF